MMTASCTLEFDLFGGFTGYLIASPGPVTDVDGLRKITGSACGSPFISRACDA